jgi:hypothetical protein
MASVGESGKFTLMLSRVWPANRPGGSIRIATPGRTAETSDVENVNVIP